MNQYSMTIEQESDDRMKEIRRLRRLVNELDEQVSKGRNYLMTVQANAITVEDTLEAFGFGRNGLD